MVCLGRDDHAARTCQTRAGSPAWSHFSVTTVGRNHLRTLAARDSKRRMIRWCGIQGRRSTVDHVVSLPCESGIEGLIQ